MDMRTDHANEGLPEAEAGPEFDYSAAFSRNIGWITESEQQQLRKKTVAIAGMGGVGGAHALTLARLGIGGFNLADFDTFDVANMNRQAGAFMSTVGLEKSAVMARMIRDINPELRLKVEPFARGLNEDNLDEFLAGVDLFVDGLDFFVIDIRRKVFKRCAELGIPAITAAPIGFGTCYLIFMPGGMSFEEYFRFEGRSERQQYLNFLLGLTPKGFHRQYLVDPSRLNLVAKTGPSTASAIQLCSGIVGVEAVKILLKRGKVHPAPAYHHFDGFLGKWSRGYLHRGNAGLLQTLKRRIGYKALGSMEHKSRPADPVGTSDIERILDLARWAPSGDNTQPWRFEILGSDKLIVDVHVEGEKHNVYDYAGGQPTLLSGGFLLETMRIAASRYGRSLQWVYLGHDGSASTGAHHRIEVTLNRDEAIREDPLCAYIPIRSVDRTPYRDRPLTAQQRQELTSTLGGELEIQWYEKQSERLRTARLNARTTDIRLRLREAYEVHRRIIDWQHKFSRSGIPAAAIGLDAMTLKSMRWAMVSWNRIRLMNRIAGTAVPQIQLDLLPGLRCAAHFTIQLREPVISDKRPEALLRAGQALQRFWLTATQMGLAMQPALAPLCFAHYASSGVTFTDSAVLTRKARALADRLTAAEQFDPARTLFRARIGWSKHHAPSARSVRKPVRELIH